MMTDTQPNQNNEEKDDTKIHVSQMITNMFSKIGSNDLTSLKKYLDSGKSNIKENTNSIEYTYEDQYDMKAVNCPKNYNECVLVLTKNGNINDFMLYTLGLRDYSELDKMIEQFSKEETVNVPTDIKSSSYKDILGIEFKLVNASEII